MAGRGGYKQTDGIIRARLNGTATRLSAAGVELEEGAAELRAITARVDLLSQEAGTFMAEHRLMAEVRPFARRAADLLLAAGAELELAEAQATETARWLQRPRIPEGTEPTGDRPRQP